MLNRATPTHLQEPLELWLIRQLRTIKGAWAGFDAELGGEVYSRGLKILADKYGRERVEAAIEVAIMEVEHFAPTLAELKRYIPPSQAHPVTCPLCVNDDGWAYYEVECNPVTRTRRTIRRLTGAEFGQLSRDRTVVGICRHEETI